MRGRGEKKPKKALVEEGKKVGGDSTTSNSHFLFHHVCLSFLRNCYFSDVIFSLKVWSNLEKAVLVSFRSLSHSVASRLINSPLCGGDVAATFFKGRRKALTMPTTSILSRTVSFGLIDL